MPREIERRKNISLIPQFAVIGQETLFPPSIVPETITADLGQQYRVRTELLKAFEQAIASGLADNPQAVANIQAPVSRLALLNGLGDYISNRGNNLGVLKPKQAYALELAASAIERGQQEITIQAPPGFGKTIIFNQFTSVAVAKDIRTLIVVPSRRLVEQTYDTFNRYTPGIDIGRVDTDHKEYGRPVTVTTYQSLTLDKSYRLIHPDGLGLVILDEVHHSTSRRRIEKLEDAKHFGKTIIIGLSATPVEIQDPGSESTRIGKLSRNIVHKIGDIEAAEEGYSAPFTAILAEVDVDLSDVKLNSDGDYDNDELEKKINTATQNKATLELFKRVKEKDQEQREQAGKPPKPFTTIVFANSVAHAQQLAKEFQQDGISARAVWGTSTKKEKKEMDEVLDKLEKGEVEVVFSKQLLVTGVDLPSVRFILNSAPTTSIVEEQQRCGRGSRLDPHDPDKHTIIADIVYKSGKKTKRPQALYAGIVKSAGAIRKRVYNPSEKIIPEPPALPLDLETVDIPGMRIIINQEEVMRITRKIADTQYQTPPEGWKPLGSSANYEGTLVQLVGKSDDWISARLDLALKRVKSSITSAADVEETSHTGVFLNKIGQPAAYHSPEVVAELIKMASEFSRPPEGALTLFALSQALGRTEEWIKPRLALVYQNLAELSKQNEQNDEISPTSYQGEFLASNMSPTTFYFSQVRQELEKIRANEKTAPDNWKVIGAPKIFDSISHEVGKSALWCSTRAKLIVKEIVAELREQGIPVDEDSHMGEFLDKRKKKSVFYSDEVYKRLKVQAEKEKPAKSGWRVIGSPHTKGSLSERIKKSAGWIKANLPTALEQIQLEQQSQGETEPNTKKALDLQGHLKDFYSPRVEEILIELAKKTS